LLAQLAGTRRFERDHPGGVRPNSGLILNAQVVDQHFEEYMANIHILHPFLEARIMRTWSTFSNDVTAGISIT
jgi:hypothetical protein